MMSELQFVINQARAAGLTAVYYSPSGKVDNGRYTLLMYANTPPQVLCNPDGVADLIEACASVGIACQELTPKMAGLEK